MKKFIITASYHQAAQNLVQGGHSSDELALEVMDGRYKDTNLGDLYLEWNKEHKTYVNLELNNQFQIIELYDWFIENEDMLSVSCAIFKEPMLNDSVTAITLVAPQKLCYNIQYFVKGFQSHIAENYQTTDFHNLKDFIDYDCKMSGCKLSYNKKSRVFEVSFDNNGEEVVEKYNAFEMEFFLKIRFLPLKK